MRDYETVPSFYLCLYEYFVKYYDCVCVDMFVYLIWSTPLLQIHTSVIRQLGVQQLRVEGYS